MSRLMVLTFALVLLAGCGSTPSGDFAISVDGEEVTREELADVLSQFGGDSALVNLRVESVVNRIVILHDARSRGLDLLPVMERFRYDTWRRRLNQSWVDTIRERITLPPDTVDVFYTQLGTIIGYTGITMDDSLMCDSLRSLVLDGDDFNQLVLQHSVNNFERQRGGVNGLMDLMLASWQDREFLLGMEQGDVSPVFMSDLGWRFLKLDTLATDSVPPLEEIRESLEGLVLSSMQDEYRTAQEDSLRSLYNLHVDTSIPGLISDRFNTEEGRFDPFTEEEYATPVFTYDGRELSLRETIDLMLDLSPVMGRTPDDFDWVDDYIRMIGIQELTVLEAEKMGLDTLEENLSYLRIRLDNKLLDVYYQQVIQPRMAADDQYLQEYYQENLELFVVPQKRIFNAIGAIGEDQVDALRSILAAGDDPFSRPADFTPVSDLVAQGEEILTRPITIDEMPAPWDSILFSTDIEETVTCSIAVDRIFLFQLIEIQPEHQGSFEESLEELVELSADSREEDVVTGLVDSLRTIYRIEIDREFVDRFIYEDTSSVETPREEIQTGIQTTE